LVVHCFGNKKTPVTVGGVGMPFAPKVKAQYPPVTGVLVENITF